MNYAEKLKNPKWQRKRLEILSRDNFSCQICGDKEATLHVHHIEYIGKNPWDTPDYLLETLCDECHSMKHVKLNDLERLLFDTVVQRDRGDGFLIKLLYSVVKRSKGL